MKRNSVVITGASSGIGAACARLFSSHGLEVVLVGRDKKKLNIVADSLQGDPLVVASDLNDESTDNEIIKLCKEKALVGLINNAGIFYRSGFIETDEKNWRAQFETNLFSPTRLTRTLIPILSKTQSPSIVNVSSTVGIHPVANMSAYAATKAAMINWTKTLALELAPKFRVNCVCPGIIDTPLHSFTNEQKKSLSNAQPLGRVGTSDEIAQAIYFLFSSPWTTGAILPVDGGISLT